MTRTIAALYVDPRGCYADVPGVELWDEARDARRYAGPWPVVAHPPCSRWGRYWYGFPGVDPENRKVLGDDGGCFAAAIASVREWGGVLEHPEASHAWRAHGVVAPKRGGGWYVAGDGIGWTCCVEQGHYGHRARKATWLYAVGCELPSLRWGASKATAKLDAGFHSAEERRRAKANGWVEADLQRLSKFERIATPPEFRDVLIAMARSVPVRAPGVGEDRRAGAA